jgi:Leucine-rich repeat (LRR) protein
MDRDPDPRHGDRSSEYKGIIPQNADPFDYLPAEVRQKIQEDATKNSEHTTKDMNKTNERWRNDTSKLKQKYFEEYREAEEFANQVSMSIDSSGDKSLNVMSSTNQSMATWYSKCSKMINNLVLEIIYDKHPDLKFVTLRCPTIFTTLAPFSKLKNLTSLHMGSNNEITDLIHLSNLTDITSLHIEGNNKITVLTALSNLGNLTLLHIGNTTIADLTPLSGLVKLKFLNLKGSRRLKNVAPLAGLTQLQVLDLTSCSLLSDITSLMGLTNLKSINLIGTNVPKVQIEALRQALPNCEILY